MELENVGNWKMQEIRKSSQSIKVGNQKKCEIRKRRKYEKVRNVKIWKLKKEGNKKKVGCWKKQEIKKNIFQRNQLIKGPTKIKIKINQVMGWTFGLVNAL